MKRLYFICPTDYIEATINQAFEGENYFLTSLGNTLVFDDYKVQEVSALIQMNEIKEVVFVLSDENRFFHETLGSNGLASIVEFSGFFREKNPKRVSSLLRKNGKSHNYILLEAYLDSKLQELNFRLKNSQIDNVEMSTMIYFKQDNSFSTGRDLINQYICFN